MEDPCAEIESTHYAEWLGYLCVAIAVFFFGTNFIPVKTFDTGDGLFFQWVLCTGIFLVGICVQAYSCSTNGVLAANDDDGFTPLVGEHECPAFQPIAMLGGFLWCTGNVMSVPTIQLIGMSLGLCVWGASNMLIGWASGTFGLFGLHAQEISDTTLNYAGVAVATVSLIIYMFVQTESQLSEEDDQYLLSSAVDEAALLGDTEKRKDPNTSSSFESGNTKSWADGMSKSTRRSVGLVLAVVSGLFYGTSFNPPQWVIDNHGCPDPHMASTNALHYIFPMYCGIWLTSTSYLILYCCYMTWGSSGSKGPIVNPKLIVPGVASGMMWAIANSSWFIANEALSFAVAFPLITSGPGLVAAAWGTFVFNEIKGRRNYILLLSAFAVMITSGVLIALSH